MQMYNKLCHFIQRERPHEKIFAHSMGIGSSLGNAELLAQEKFSTIASAYIQENPLRWFQEEFSEKVSMNTIDAFCPQLGIQGIDHLKLDVEGSEYQATVGAQMAIAKGVVRSIQFEFGEFQLDSRTFFRGKAKLSGNDCRLYTVVADGITQINKYSLGLEVFGTTNFLAEFNGIRRVVLRSGE
jgi:hypothetical protein